MFHFLSQIAEDQAMVETINSKERKDQNSRINTVVNKLIIPLSDRQITPEQL